MLLRALVVLLVILNFGVAAWWAVRGDAGDAHAFVAGGSLVLASEVPQGAVQASDDEEPARDAAEPATALGERAPPLPARQAAEPPQCFALGPFADTAARDAARLQLATVAVRLASRDVIETPRGWRVWMAPLADRAAADAMVARLLEAGFTDYYVIADGEESNGVALGRFGSEAPAQGRAAALRTAGFDAQAQPLGSVLVRYWLDAMAAEGEGTQTLRTQVAAARIEPRDCDVSWDAG